MPTATVSSARGSSSDTREPSKPFVGDFQILKSDLGAHLRSKIEADYPIEVEEQMVSSDVPQVENGRGDQLSNHKVRIIAKFPEIPVGVVYLFS